MRTLILTTYGGRKIHIAVAKIAAFVERPNPDETFTEIYLTGDETPFLVTQNVQTIQNMLDLQA